ncbi:hypothetical protein [Candidatus Vondammii sp. HM_W22]|uniref:hypothetical protein n=1 Tax=Candidatus Vondammii sp. HM_W22 TaxID=2687299 RepID=UPI001F134FFB|nr:hypothetical protein [Candidatus Vondammii sp. HM_W22]
MVRRKLKRPISPRDAVEMCLEFARERRNLSADRVADRVADLMWQSSAVQMDGERPYAGDSDPPV